MKTNVENFKEVTHEIDFFFRHVLRVFRLVYYEPPWLPTLIRLFSLRISQYFSAVIVLRKNPF